MGDDYLHADSGMLFPHAVAAFRRVNTNQYDGEGLDVSVGYNLVAPTGGIAATVYVYPAPSLISIGSPDTVVAAARADLTNAEFQQSLRGVLDSHPGADLLRQEDAELRQGGSVYRGREAAFSYEGVFANKRQAIDGELSLFGYVGGEWLVKYRFSYPADFDARDRIAEFMQALEITVPPES